MRSQKVQKGAVAACETGTRATSLIHLHLPGKPISKVSEPEDNLEGTNRRWQQQEPGLSPSGR